MRWLTQSHLLMQGLLVLISSSFPTFPVSLDTHKNLTRGFLHLLKYTRSDPARYAHHDPFLLSLLISLLLIG